MQYIGSKFKLIGFIKDTVHKYCGDDLSTKTFCDIFAGTGVVGANFSPLVKRVISNDFETYSFIANSVLLSGYDKDAVAEILNKINSVEGDYEGSLYNAYADGGNKGRRYFSKENGAKISAARKYLSSISHNIDFKTYLAVLFSIIDGADKVANTMAVYGAYSKKIKKSALKEVFFELPPRAKKNGGTPNKIYKADANELIRQIKGDILYLDPPYNGRQYGSNYHVLNAIAFGEAPETDSKTGIGEYNKSKYCYKSAVYESLESLIRDADFEWIFLSYNNEGLLTFEQIRLIMEKYGDYYVESRKHQRYKADNKRRQAADSTIEYIHVLHKTSFRRKDEDADNNPQNLRIKKISLKSVELSPCDKPLANGRVYPKETVEKAVEEFNERVKNSEILGELSHPEKEDVLSEQNLGKSVAQFEAEYFGQPEPIKQPELKPIVSPMNYMGGKKKLLPQLLRLFPKNISTFVDLFCGGATVGVNSPCENVIFNDAIEPLMELYFYIYRTDYSEGIRYINEQIEEWGLTRDNKDAYVAFRTHYNDTELAKRHPLDLIILMAYSFSNQIRFNADNKFNVPFGNRCFNNKIRENLIKFWYGLQEKNCTFWSTDFSEFNFEALPQGSFVYADPPYLISHATYNSDWNEEKEKELYRTLLHIDALGYKFALSNVLENNGKRNTMLEDWANYYHFNIIHLDKSYSNSYYQRKERDSKTDEVLIINY